MRGGDSKKRNGYLLLGFGFGLLMEYGILTAWIGNMIPNQYLKMPNFAIEAIKELDIF